jgi:calcineurin-like phosphoesterase family protein
MTTWFTADLHLGHRNIISYCDRPFESVGAMNRTLAARWNEIVDDDDTVWVLGDFALGTIADTLPMAGEMRGRLLLLTGNHDRWWAGHGRRAVGWTDRYLEAGFAEVRHGTATIDIGGTEVRLCHFPYPGDSHDRDRYVEHRPDDDGSWLLHGHVHERWGQDGRMINVGVDAAGFRPVSAAEIAALIADGPAWRSQVVAG